MENILTLIGVFIAAAILIGIGAVILGSAVTDCTGITGYVVGDDDDGATPTHNQTGWAGQCFSNQEQSQSGYGLIGVVLIVLAAVIVLSVVRLLA